MNNSREIVSSVISILPKAKRILENQKQITIQEKEGLGNIVTNVDIYMEKYLCDSLQSRYSEAQIIAEESADSCEVKNSSLKFVIDPLDGSTNFSNSWPHSIAIGVVGEDELIGGVIYDALQEKIYAAVKCEGVVEIDINDMENVKKVEKPQYPNGNIKKSVIAHDTPYGNEAFDTTVDVYSELVKEGASAKTVGPISLDVLKAALGAENRPHDYYDAVWHMEVRAWDLCASTAILRELGGDIIGKDGKPLSIDTLTNPRAKIAFFASGNEKLRDNIYNIYEKVAEKGNER